MVTNKLTEELPKAVVKRLPQYYRFFKRCVSDKVARTNSKIISESLGVDAATVRRDFSYFGEMGRRGYGYDTKHMRDFFGELLGEGLETNIALIGVGNLGRALINYKFHERNKMRITQAYDVTEHLAVGTTTPDGIPIYDIATLKEHLKEQDIKTAILSVQSDKAQEVTDLLVEAGIQGILNFTPRRLHAPGDVVIQSIDLTSELQTLLFIMNDKQDKL